MATRPALALPGWFVERTGPDGPVVFNPRTLASSPSLGAATACPTP